MDKKEERNEEKLFKEVKKYDYKTDKIEKFLSFAGLVLFLMSFNGGIALNVAFYAFATTILLYYFIWFRKKPPYVILEGSRITVHNNLFFKPLTFDTKNISSVKKHDRGIEIEFKEKDAIKHVKIYSFLLDSKDLEELHQLLS